MSQTRLTTRLAAACGLAGTLALAAYFLAPAVTGWPYAGASPAYITTYALEHQSLFYAGAWLQSTGALLCVVFFLYLVRASREGQVLVQSIVVVTATSLLAIVLVESALLVAVPMAASAGDAATVATTFALSNGVFVRVFPLAPSSATYIALGVALFDRSPLRRGFAYSALSVGVAFELAGAAAIFTGAALIPLAVLAAGQALWIAAAAVALWRSASRLSA
jgi:hypothetical protein